MADATVAMVATRSGITPVLAAATSEPTMRMIKAATSA